MFYDYHYYKDYNDYSDYNEYSDYNDYRDSDLDLDWELFSDLVTQLTITDKLRNLNYDIEGLTLNVMIQVLQFVSKSDWQRMTWSAFAILAMFKDTNGLRHNLTWHIPFQDIDWK